MTDEQRAKLKSEVIRLRAIAKPAGTLHAYWDIIFDLEAFLAGRPTIVQMSAEEWLQYVGTM